MNRVSDTVKHLIIINIIFYIGFQFIGVELYKLLALWFPENTNFGFWQIITHMFMHSKTFFLHIVFNMLALWMFGTPLEQMWGRNKFLFFYFSAGLGAVILPFIIDYIQFKDLIVELNNNGFDTNIIINTLNEGKYFTTWEDILGNDKFQKLVTIFNKSSVGASGAVMGLLAAFGLNFPNAKLALIFLPIPVAAKYFIPTLLGYELLSGIFNWPSMFGINVAHFAHIGGAVIGGIIAWYWKKNQFKIL